MVRTGGGVSAGSGRRNREVAELERLALEQARDDGAKQIDREPTAVPAQCSGRKTHHPAGFRDEAGWLVRVDGRDDPVDVYLRAERDRAEARATPGQLSHAELALRRELSTRIERSSEESWWTVVLGLYLDLFARFPRHRRKHVAWLLSFVQSVMAALVPGRPLLPETVSAATLARLTGEHLERVTVSDRGGGRGARARRSVAGVVAALQAESAARAALGLRILESIAERRGVRGVEALRKIVGGRAGPIRAALADLLAREAIENRGTETHPHFFVW